MKNYIYDIYDRLKTAIQPVYLRNQSDKAKALIAVCIVCFFWGTTWLASKKGVQYMPAIQLAGFRQLIAGILYLIFFFFKGFRLPTRDQFIQFTWMSMLMIVMNNGLSTWSMKYMPSGLGSVIAAASPLWIAIISSFLFKETRLNTTTVIGLLLGIAGIGIIFSAYLHDLFNSSFSKGVVLNVIASISWAFGTIYTVKNAKHINPYFSLGWQMAIGGVILLLCSWFTNEYISPFSADIRTWYSITYLVIIGSVITYSAFIYALKRLPAAQVSIYAYINPIVAVIVGALLNNEKLTIAIASGTLVTIFGIYLVNTGFKRSEAKSAKN
ncbi:MAG: EamA family transporter [Agriterribacter sp.]